MAADTQTNFGSLRSLTDNHRALKIKKIGAAYVGTTGWGVYDNILDDFPEGTKLPPLTTRKSIFRFFMRLWKSLHERYSLVNDQCDDHTDSPFGDLDASFIIANALGIFHVSSDMSVTQFEKYYAVGSGADFSLGALYVLYDEVPDAVTLATRAVEAAIALNNTCGGEIEVRRVRMR